MSTQQYNDERIDDVVGPGLYTTSDVVANRKTAAGLTFYMGIPLLYCWGFLVYKCRGCHHTRRCEARCDVSFTRVPCPSLSDVVAAGPTAGPRIGCWLVGCGPVWVWPVTGPGVQGFSGI